MFAGIKQRFSDMRTIKALCESAERHALRAGQAEPGLEHFILAALALPDGSARKAFARIGADPAAFEAAIAQQYADALQAVGVGVDTPDTPLPPRTGLYQAGASAQAMLRQLAEWPRARPDEALSGAHVIAVGAATRHGVAARAFKRMGIDAAALAGAARAEIAS